MSYYIDEYIDVLSPDLKMFGPVEDNSLICVTTPPGCWGPMITPSIKSGHEVTKPINVKNAMPGDAIAITIKKIKVISAYTTSGVSKAIEGRYKIDPTINAICPTCNITNPETYTKGYGEQAIKCKQCNNSIVPQTIEEGYTLIFDQEKKIGISVTKEKIKKIIEELDNPLPNKSKQHLSSKLLIGDVQNIISRVKPMIGNIGTIPSKKVPSSRNSGDVLKTLIKSDEFSNVNKEDLTDGHMDINTVTEDSIVIVPVKVAGGGVYLGDVHSVQGNGELAGHTADISAHVDIKVNVIKNLNIDGPIIIPNKDTLSDIYQPISENDYQITQEIANKHNLDLPEKSYPIQFVGSDENLNKAIDNAILRAEKATGLSANEIKNRATVSGSVDIGRTSGIIYITVMLPVSIIKEMNLLKYVLKLFEESDRM